MYSKLIIFFPLQIKKAGIPVLFLISSICASITIIPSAWGRTIMSVHQRVLIIIMGNPQISHGRHFIK